MGIFKPSRALVRELEAGGVRTRATVVKIARGGPTSERGSEGSPDPIESTARRKTTVRVPTPTGAVEVTARLLYRMGGVPKVGEDVPVVYDPADPERIVVDEHAHLVEVTARHGGPVTHLGGAAGEIRFGDPDELIAAAGHDPADLVEQARRIMADPGSATTPAVDASTAIAHLEALHAQGLMSAQELEAARRHLGGG